MVLYRAVLTDDPRLVQEQTVYPHFGHDLTEYPIVGACAIGFCGWQGSDLESAPEVDDYFARLTGAIDDDAVLKESLQAAGYSPICPSGDFLGWFDGTPRDAMRRALKAELEWSFAQPHPDDLDDVPPEPVYDDPPADDDDLDDDFVDYGEPVGAADVPVLVPCNGE